MKRFLGFVFFLVSFSFCINAQNSFAEKTVNSFFPKAKKIEWLEHYKGRIDGTHQIAVTLAYDGKSLKGLLIYLKSKELFRLDGVLKGNELTMLEVDENGTITGQMEGYVEGKNIELSWSNIDDRIGKSVFLTQNPKTERLETSCGKNKWIRVYKGIIFGEKVDLVLQKYNQNQLKGTAYFENENKSYDLSGEVYDHDDVKIQFKDDKKQLKGELEGIIKNESSISANFFSNKGQRSPTLFMVEETLEVDCIEYADYTSSYDITFPKVLHKSFNQWMENMADFWEKDCQQHAFEAGRGNASKDPKLRSSIQASAWSEVDFYDENFISGFLTFENTWTDEVTEKSFNYDFRASSEIGLDDIFKEGFDYQSFVFEYLDREIDRHQLYHDYEFRKWLSKQDFSIFLIHKDGLAFCTSFSSVYGRQKIKIPYEVLKPFFKENHILNHLVN